MAFILYLIPIAIYLFYKWATANYDFFEKQGIACDKKPLPFLGSNFLLLFKKKPMVTTLMDFYKEFKHEK